MSRWKAEMAAWWDGRTERERWMLRGLGVVLAGLVFWYGLVVPLGELAEAAEARHDEAAATLMQARGLAAALKIAQTGAPAGADAVVVRQAAVQSGVAIARETPEPDGGLSVWMEEAAARPLFVWLATLQREHGVAVRTFEAHRAETGGLEARVVLAGPSR